MPLTTVNPGLLDTQAQYTGFKNRIINGDMRIAQRGTTSSGIGSSAYATVDRFLLDTRINASPTGSYTQEQSTDAPSGFKNSFSVTVSTAGNSLSSSYGIALCHFIEGYNVADLGWGTASAQSITLSFWVKASIAGVYSFALINAGYSRSYVTNYTVNSANTWEQKSVTIAGETTGTWDSTNGRGIQIKFSLGSGSNYVTSSPNTWLSGEYLQSSTASASASFWNTTGATWKITGVQLEKGSTATSFDYRPYGTELSLCQRYYYRINASTTGSQAIGLGYQMSASTTSQMTVIPKVTMRAVPTLGFNNLSVTDYTSYTATVSSISGSYGSPDFIQMQVTHASAGSSFRPTSLYPSGTTGSFFDMSAEL